MVKRQTTLPQLRQRLALRYGEIDDVSFLHGPLWNTAAAAWKAKLDPWSWVVVVRVRVRVRDQRHIFVSIATMRTSSCLARRASSAPT